MQILFAKFYQFLAGILLFFFIACRTNSEIKIDYPLGGYEYPKHVADSDTTFYYYPLKDIFSTKDSFMAGEEYYFFKIFNEPNLSLKPAEKTTFRLTYQGAMVSSVIIILTPDEIVIKKRIKGWVQPAYDTAKLTEKEKLHYDILGRFFPLNGISHKKWTQLYLDSLAGVYPELLDPKYYKYLLDKSSDYIGYEKFEYTIKRIPISNQTFGHLVNRINDAGYWELPLDTNCKYPASDGVGFILEANTPKKYNMVIMPVCYGESSKYTKACQELVKFAKMEKEIQLWDSEEKASDTLSEKVKKNELKLGNIKENK